MLKELKAIREVMTKESAQVNVVDSAEESKKDKRIAEL